MGVLWYKSDLTGGNYTDLQGNILAKPANGLALDFGVAYQNKIIRHNNADLMIGLSIQNMGTKVSYNPNQKGGDFIPGIIKFGVGYKFTAFENEIHKVAILSKYSAEKMLIPSYPIYALDSLGNIRVHPNGYYIIEKGLNPDVSVLKGAVQSFYDSPYGFGGELDEVLHKFSVIGIYDWNDKISISYSNGLYIMKIYNGINKTWTSGIEINYNNFKVGTYFSQLLKSTTTQVRDFKGFGLTYLFELPE